MHRITQTEGNLITVRVSEKLTTADYAELIPAWDRLLAAQGSMRMLFIMENFHGWEPAAAWKDMCYGTKHARQVDRVAMVGEKSWQKWLTKIGSLFVIHTQVEYFDSARLAEAEQWVRASS